ncbi:MAG: DUF5333 domain-containing protein [Pseudomonadota bacterium]
MTGPAKAALAALGLIAFALIVTSGAARADNFDALRTDAEIENGVLIVAIGDIMRDNCPGFELRRVPAAAFFWGLVDRARALGYSTDEIRAYVDNDADVERVQARARLWLQQQGADLSVPETICEIARDEISNDTVIGRLIREG